MERKQIQTAYHSLSLLSRWERRARSGSEGKREGRGRDGPRLAGQVRARERAMGETDARCHSGSERQ